MKKMLIFLLFIMTPFMVFAYPKGDVNGDNIVDNMDVALVRNHIRGTSKLTGDKLTRADVSGDNKVDNMDVVLIRNIIRGQGSTISDKTPPTVSSCIASVKYDANNKTYDTNYFVTATDDSGIDYYLHNNKKYTSSSFTVANDTENDVVTVYDKAGNKKDITCSYSSIEPTSSNNVISESKYSSSTLKYWMEKPTSNFVVTHIWVKDSLKQLKTISKSDDPGTVQKASLYWKTITSTNGNSKGAIGINASGFINKDNDDYWNYNGWKETKNHYSSRLSLIINDGKIVRNWTNKELPSTLYPVYALKSNRYLTSYQFKSGASNISYNKEIKNKIVSDGVQNTFSFRPILINQYSIYTSGFTGDFCTEPNFRQAICQVDRNNFVLITSVNASGDADKLTTSDRKKGFTCQKLAETFAKYNCRTAFNVDGGGSVSLRYKKNSSKTTVVMESTREVADMLYFIEQ